MLKPPPPNWPSPRPVGVTDGRGGLARSRDEREPLGALAHRLLGRLRRRVDGRLHQREGTAEARRRRVVDGARARHAREQLVAAPVGDLVLVLELVE